MEAWIKKYVAFLIQYCDFKMKDALEEAKKVWGEAQFKFNLEDVCVTDDGFTVSITDMVYEDSVAYYICKPLEFNCPIERSYTAEQLTLKRMTRDTKLHKFWCCDVRKFDSKRIKAIVYPVYAEYLPEDDDPKNKMCEQHRYYMITYAEAMSLKRSYDQVDTMIAEMQEKRNKR